MDAASSKIVELRRPPPPLRINKYKKKLFEITGTTNSVDTVHRRLNQSLRNSKEPRGELRDS